MEFKSVEDAEKKNLIQLTIWQRDTKKERESIERAVKQVLINKGRIAMPVKRGGLICLYANDVSTRR